MYLQHFQLASMPFENTPDPRFLFATPEHEEALAALQYGVSQRRGMTAIIGPPGTGKTLLGHVLLERIGHQVRVATIGHPPQDAHDLIATLCRQFDVRVHRQHATGEMVERLEETLAQLFYEQLGCVLLVDEAQTLSGDLLEHLRMLGNLERESQRLLQIVLLGQREFTAHLQESELEQFRQRVFCVRELRPFNRQQTHDYIRHRLAIAGRPDPDLFTPDAIDLISERSAGLPRNINQIADNALLAGYGGRFDRIDRSLVLECLPQMMLPQEDRSAGDNQKSPPVLDPDSMKHEEERGSAPTRKPMASPEGDMNTNQLSVLTTATREASAVVGHLSSLLDDARRQADVLAGSRGSSRAILERLEQSFRLVEESRSLIAGRINEFQQLQDRVSRALGEMRETIQQSADSGRHTEAEIEARAAACLIQLEAQTTAIHDASASVKSLLGRLEQERSAATEQLHAWQQSQDAADRKAARLAHEVERVQEADGQVAARLNDVQAALEQVNCAHEPLHGLLRDIDKRHDQDRNLQAELLEITQQTERQQHELRELLDQVSRDGTKAEETGARLATDIDEIHRTTQRVEETQRAIIVQDKAARASADHLQDRERQAYTTLTELQRVAGDADQAIAECQAAANLLEDTRASLLEDVERTQRETQRATALEAQLRKQSIQLTAGLHDAHRQVQALARQVADAASVADDVQQAASQAENTKQQLAAQEASAVEAAARIEHTIDVAHRAGDQISEQLVGMQDRIGEADSLTANLTEQITAGRTIEKALAHLAQQSGEDVEALRQQTGDLREAVVEATDSLHAAEAGSSDCRQAARTANEIATQLQEAAAEGQARLDEITAAAGKAAAQQQRAGGEISRLANEAAGLAGAVAEAQSLQSQLQEHARAFEACIESASRRESSLQGTLHSAAHAQEHLAAAADAGGEIIEQQEAAQASLAVEIERAEQVRRNTSTQMEAIDAMLQRAAQGADDLGTAIARTQAQSADMATMLESSASAQENLASSVAEIELLEQQSQSLLDTVQRAADELRTQCKEVSSRQKKLQQAQASASGVQQALSAAVADGRAETETLTSLVEAGEHHADALRTAVWEADQGSAKCSQVAQDLRAQFEAVGQAQDELREESSRIQRVVERCDESRAAAQEAAQLASASQAGLQTAVSEANQAVEACRQAGQQTLTEARQALARAKESAQEVAQEIVDEAHQATASAVRDCHRAANEVVRDCHQTANAALQQTRAAADEAVGRATAAASDCDKAATLAEQRALTIRQEISAASELERRFETLESRTASSLETLRAESQSAAATLHQFHQERQAARDIAANLTDATARYEDRLASGESMLEQLARQDESGELLLESFEQCSQDMSAAVEQGESLQNSLNTSLEQAAETSRHMQAQRESLRQQMDASRAAHEALRQVSDMLTAREQSIVPVIERALATEHCLQAQQAESETAVAELAGGAENARHIIDTLHQTLHSLENQRAGSEEARAALQAGLDNAAAVIPKLNKHVDRIGQDKQAAAALLGEIRTESTDMQQRFDAVIHRAAASTLQAEAAQQHMIETALRLLNQSDVQHWTANLDATPCDIEESVPDVSAMTKTASDRERVPDNDTSLAGASPSIDELVESLTRLAQDSQTLRQVIEGALSRPDHANATT